MQQEKAFVTKNGVTYFSRKTERSVLFIMTLGMLIWGIIEKWG